MPIARVVNEINLEGASIETSDKWYVGTVLHVQLVLANESSAGEAGEQAALHFGVWAKVVRRELLGICVEFIYTDPNDRRDFGRFVRAAEQRRDEEQI